MSFEMNNYKLTFLLVLILVYLQFGCSTYYGIANRGTESKYLEKPVYVDSTTSRGYIGVSGYTGPGYIINNIGTGTNDADWTYYGDLSYHQGISGKFYSAAFGGAANLGIYEQYNFPDLNRFNSF